MLDKIRNKIGPIKNWGLLAIVSLVSFDIMRSYREYATLIAFLFLIPFGSFVIKHTIPRSSKHA